MAMSISANGSQWVELGHDMELMVPSMPLVIERTEKMSFPFGDLSVRQIGLPDIYIVHGDMFFKQRKLHFRASDLPDMVELHFALIGGGTIHNHINNQSHTFQPRMQNMFYMPHLNGTGEYLTEKNYQFFEVHFTKDRFLSLVKDFGPTLKKFADDIADGHHSQLSKENLPISFAMNNCIQDIIHCPYSGGLKLLFLQSKSIELLVLQAEAFEQFSLRKDGSVVKSAYDKDRIIQAKDYLLQHADMPPSLPELARLAGTNEFKLKSGFRELFNNSVFGYLSEYKLDRAKEMLIAGIPIKQIVSDLGYSSAQHFSLAFKKRYGTTPGRIKA